MSSDAIKYALCLRGESHAYQKTCENIKLNVIDSLNIQDVFLSTYHHDDFEAMVAFYKPKAISTPKNERESYTMVRKHTLACLHELKKTKVECDYVIITRFDAFFEYDFKRMFEEKVLSPEDFSVMCRCELKVEHVDDMLWIVPMKLVDTLIEVLELMQRKRIWTHSINQQMNTKVGRPVTRPLFEGNYFLQKKRPFMKLSRELPDQPK